MRKIPRTLGTQHPDNALKPYWAANAFIDTSTEIEECFRSFSDLGTQEFMWDWEGKNVDESAVEKLFENYTEYFRANSIGKDFFFTMRLPNIWEEKGYRLSKAFVNIISANQMAEDLGFNSPVLFEAILPMTKSVDQLFFLHSRFRQIQKAFDSDLSLELIPLVEEVPGMCQVDDLLLAYVEQEKRDYLRVFLARSDPSLNSGNVSATLGAKIGLSKMLEFQEKTSIVVYPMIGVGSLPFRGGLTPLNAGKFFEEYSGVHTVTLQSAFRYDYAKEEVEKAIREINSSSTKAKAVEEEKLMPVIGAFTREYQLLVEPIAPMVNSVSKFIPQRRERKLHVGLFGYARKMQGVTLPRAIAFTASMYSLGVPPELLGVGTALSKLEGKDRDALYENYLFFEEDLRQAGVYLNKENLHALAAQNNWQAVEKDILLLEKELGELGPVDDNSLLHRNLTSNVRIMLKNGRNPTPEIERAAELRKSLG